MHQSYEFDAIERSEAEAVGLPGQRRFRMIFSDGLQTVVLWLEKQQLQALGLAFEQMLAQLRAAGVREARVREIDASPIGPIPASAEEMQVGRLAVGYDEEKQRVVVFAHDAEVDDQETPDVVSRLSLQQAATMAKQIEVTVSAGRPTCPRCSAPIGPEGHVCPHDNGHFPHLLS